MPQQYQQFLDVSDALGYDAEWMLKPLTVGSGSKSKPGPQLLHVFTSNGRDKLREFANKRAVVQQYVPNQLLAFGQPVSLRLYILITSTSPLRAYVHSEGLVYHRYDDDKNYKKVSEFLNYTQIYK